ncbi:MAG: primosomal protein N' [Planctomycetota bacterium]|nr:primosomal protein N' [Planctomycetota bacterium]
MSHRQQQHLFDAAPTQTPWEDAADADHMCAQVVFNRPLDTTFSYLVPDTLREAIQPGQRIRAPFGRGDRQTVGYCVGIGPPSTSVRRLKHLDSIIDDVPLLSPSILKLTAWIAERYLCPWGQVLETVVPSGVKKLAGTRVETTFTAAGSARTALEGKLPPKQRTVLELLLTAKQPLGAADVREQAECGMVPIQGLVKKGLVIAGERRVDTYDLKELESAKTDDLVLNDEQTAALRSIHDALRSGQHSTILLHGVTGSGKTEVYIQAIREVVSYGRQSIVLVPEISLTPQTIRRFRSRFNSVAVLHSHLSDAERHMYWQRIARGDVEVIVGARSAVFAPAPHLGLIVIDEEHETSFKQETAPRYHAREVARTRAAIQNVPLILGSATPTLESWRRVQERQDTLIAMHRRVADLPLPPVLVVDVRNDPRMSQGASLGRALHTAMQKALADGGQVILFLNLRGFSPTIWCRSCGEALKCPHCDISLTWHKDRAKAVCHFCDYATDQPKSCPQCGNIAIRYFGVGTQRLEQEVRSKFANYKCLRMDSDSMRKPGSHDTALESFRAGEVQILLGTQMIAKGLDFPNVTLVGVIDADTMLHQPDLRSAERTFQLIAQVAGRTGRSERGGRVLVQTCSPDEPAIRLAAGHDYLNFARYEMKHRREMSAPPFRTMARVILRGPKEPHVYEASKEFATKLRTLAESLKLPVDILGPAPAPLAKLKDNYRYHFQMSADHIESIHSLWKAAVKQPFSATDVEFVVDVDPMNLR